MYQEGNCPLRWPWSRRPLFRPVKVLPGDVHRFDLIFGHVNWFILIVSGHVNWLTVWVEALAAKWWTRRRQGRSFVVFARTNAALKE